MGADNQDKELMDVYNPIISYDKLMQIADDKIRKNKFDDAIDYFRSALDGNLNLEDELSIKDRFSIIQKLKNLYKTNSQFKEAKVLMENEIFKEFGANVNDCIEYGEILLALGDIDDAIDHFSYALEKDQSNYRAIDGMVQSYINKASKEPTYKALNSMNIATWYQLTYLEVIGKTKIRYFNKKLE